MSQENLSEFFQAYIDGTPEKAKVPLAKFYLCNLTHTVAGALGLIDGTYSVYISTIALKHMYDKRPAEEFACLLRGLAEIVRYPTKVYQNREGRRGSFCLFGSYNKSDYICSIELVEVSLAGLNQTKIGASIKSASGETRIEVVTAFRKRDEKYLSKYALLWSRGNGNPHRSALDAHKESTNTPQ